MRSLEVIQLPCDPCPHGAPCCSRGTELTREEARAIARTLGRSDVVEVLSPEESLARFHHPVENTTYATTVVNGRCVFWNRGCSLYHTELYPVMCRGFPWTDGLSDITPATDANLCPEVRAQ